jgi:hypothetical protein
METYGCFIFRKNESLSAAGKTILGQHVSKRSLGRLLINTTGCEITTGVFRTFPELFGETETSVGTPNFYLPDKTPVAADDELQALKEITPTAVTQLNDVMVRISARRQTLDVNSLLHIRQTSLQQQQTYWHFCHHCGLLHCHTTSNLLFLRAIPFAQLSPFLFL